MFTLQPLPLGGEHEPNLQNDSTTGAGLRPLRCHFSQEDEAAGATTAVVVRCAAGRRRRSSMTMVADPYTLVIYGDETATGL